MSDTQRLSGACEKNDHTGCMSWAYRIFHHDGANFRPTVTWWGNRRCTCDCHGTQRFVRMAMKVLVTGRGEYDS